MLFLHLPVELMCKIGGFVAELNDLRSLCHSHSVLYTALILSLYQLAAEKNRSPCEAAALEGDYKRVFWCLLAARKAPRLSEEWHLESGLHAAAQRGDCLMVKMFLVQQVDMNCIDPYTGATPLHSATQLGRLPIVSMLSSVGADLEIPDFHLETPLHKAVATNNQKIVEVLLRYGADPNAMTLYEETPLALAAKLGHAKIVSLLIDAGSRLDAANMYGETPLHKAVCWGHESVVNLLLWNKADANALDSQGRTPLSYAARWGWERITRNLLSAGADREIQDYHHQTPLAQATQMENPAMVELLLYSEPYQSYHGARVDILRS